MKSVVLRVLKKVSDLSFKARAEISYNMHGLRGIYAFFANCRSNRVLYLLKRFGASIGDRVSFAGPIFVENAHYQGDFSKLHIGDNTYIGKNVFFDLTGEIKIHSNCSISANVVFITHSDPGERPLRRSFSRIVAGITVGTGVWIGGNSVIMPGISIGECSAIGAVTVLTKDVDSHTRVLGKIFYDVRELKGEEAPHS